MNKKKLATSVAAVATAAALLLGGTFAWQSANQTALNEASDVINPGGRLHDDFYIDDNGNYNSDIYVENFADDEIFARVKLQEYMEIVINHGVAGAEIVETVVGSKTLNDAPAAEVPTDNTSGYEYEYVTHCFDQPNATEEYWDWTMGAAYSAEVYYMPTFNMNKDSLVADRNGMYVDRIGGISNRGQTQYTDWNVWGDSDTKPGTEIYDIDPNRNDEVGYDFENLQTYVDEGNIKTVTETHEAKLVGYTNGLISMSQWLEKLHNGEDTADYWVYDEDGSGWIYWSSPVAAKSTTGLLLDSIELKQVMNDTWYYAIEAVGQFVTANDAGKGDGTGFYDETAEGNTAPSADAELLLTTIGVTLDVSEGDNQDPDDIEQVYTMHLYLSGSNYANYLVPGTAYTLEIAAEENEYGDELVALTVMDENGEALTEGEDYEIGNDSLMFEDYDGSFDGDYAYGATTTLKILNENLVGTQVTIEAVADQTGNTETIEVSVNYDQLEVTIQLYDADGNLVAGTGNGATIAPNSIYDLVGSITGQDGTEYVIYSTLASKPVSTDIVVPDAYVTAYADYHLVNYINESGQLVVGDAETFDCTDWMPDGITNTDSLALGIGADVVRIYENADAIQNGEEPTEIYYTYGQWDIYPTGLEKYEVSVGDLNVSRNNRTNYLLILDGNNRDISGRDGLTVTMSGSEDTDGTKLELIPATAEASASYLLTIGEEETATELTITASDSNGMGSRTVKINYLNTLKVGDSESDQWGYVYINSSDNVTVAELSLVDYQGYPIYDEVTYTMDGGNTSDETYVEDCTLYIGAAEQGWPIYLYATVDEVTTEYQLYASYSVFRDPSISGPTEYDFIHYWPALSDYLNAETGWAGSICYDLNDFSAGSSASVTFSGDTAEKSYIDNDYTNDNYVHLFTEFMKNAQVGDTYTLTVTDAETGEVVEHYITITDSSEVYMDAAVILGEETSISISRDQIVDGTVTIGLDRIAAKDSLTNQYDWFEWSIVNAEEETSLISTNSGGTLTELNIDSTETGFEIVISGVYEGEITYTITITE